MVCLAKGLDEVFLDAVVRLLQIFQSSHHLGAFQTIGLLHCQTNQVHAIVAGGSRLRGG